LNFERDFILKQQDIKNQAFTQQKRSLLLQTKAVAEAMQAQRDAVKGFYEDLNEDALIGFMDKITTSVVGVEESRRRSLVRQAAEELQAAIDREEIAVKSLEADKLRHKLQMESAEAAKKSILEPLKPLGDTLEHLISIKALNSDINHLTSEQADTLEFLITQYSEDYDAMFSGVQEDLDLANKTMGGIKQLQINTEKDLREARTESLRLSLEQQRVYAEKIAEQWAGIGEAITGSISGATQSMMTEIATLIYDDSADQKRKDLNKARKAELKAFKGTMQERMDIEKKYAEEKKALDEEEANRLPNILKATLRNLAIEATGKALFEGAAALASLAIRDFEGAALHGKSAAAYGIVAGVMGSATLLAGGPTNAASGGGTVAGSSTTSPTGLSQTGVNREEAKSNEPVVFNINFAGANIYDSREAALRALSNEIFRVGQQSQRGSRFIPRGV
jgi:hypothetical protein